MNQIVKKDEQLPVATDNTVSLLAVIERAAKDPAVDIEKMERLMAMHERLIAKQAEAAFNEAMNQAQSEIGRIATDSENKATNSRYASYATLDRVLRPIYTSHGFSLSFDTGESAENTVKVLCYVSHRAGHTRTYTAVIPADGKGAKGGDVMTKTHAVGSGMQYGQRYLLKLIFNVAVGQDDDGNGAGKKVITEVQAADLEALITEVGANKAAFLKWLKAKSLEEIPATAYDGAVKMLEAKRKQQAAV